mmetsp:Transcript_7668/g.26107  ORF Transcript_7668/g.26107 Transcript_7668/m.26107 type:complete len:209 (-) Transcript_7668:223-849(-)
MLAPTSASRLLMAESTPGSFLWQLRMRWAVAFMGSSRGGKLTAPAVTPALMKALKEAATSRPIMRCASMVEPPMCGLRIVLGQPQSSLLNTLSPLFLGSSGNTSTAAPPRWPALRASARAETSTTSPRARLMRMAPCFIWKICLAPNMPRVSGVRGTCRDTMSASARSPSRVSEASALPRLSFGAVSKNLTFIPRASARIDTWDPTWP